MYHVYPFVFATACAVYASKCYRMLAICNCMRRTRLQKIHFYTILLAYVAHAVAICYRMRRIR
jgi:hypothetical protein